jgi:hypothetical protein
MKVCELLSWYSLDYGDKATADVTYDFTNRTPDMRLTRAAYQWLETQIQGKVLDTSLDRNGS